MRALLDVNFLIALLDEHHTSHAAAIAWFSDNANAAWASCPITQNGCIRILANPRHSGKGRLVTFDRSIAIDAVTGATRRNLVVL